MSNSKYKFEYSPHLTILGLIFFAYIFLSGWGTDPNQYGRIQDSTMDCIAILRDVQEVGIFQYILNGKPDAPEHYYTKRQLQYRKQYEQLKQQQEQLDRQRYLSKRN